MNRMQEYRALLSALEQEAPQMTRSLLRARQRRRRQRWIRPAAAAAGVWIGFVLLVNWSVPVAQACARVPVLRELAQAVQFSRALSQAVQHDYAQQIALEKTQEAVTARVEYVIVDQKQVNIFYRVTGGTDQAVWSSASVQDAQQLPKTIVGGTTHGDSGALERVTVDYMDADVPDQIRLTIDVYARENPEKAPQAAQRITQFEFDLAFDPAFTAQGTIVPVHETLTLDGQRFTVESLAIYPTHMRVTLLEDAHNTAYLVGLSFHVLADEQRLDPAGTVTAVGGENTQSMLTYWCDSPYFDSAQHLQLVVTGAQLLDREQPWVQVDLANGRMEQAPEGMSLTRVEKTQDGWIVTVQAPGPADGTQEMLINRQYRDAQGVVYQMDQWSVGGSASAPHQIVQTCFLTDYDQDLVWLCPRVSRFFAAPQPIVLEIPQWDR